MWLLRRRRQKIIQLEEDADRRLSEAHAREEAARQRRPRSEQVTQRSRELARQNSIAAIIRASLGAPRSTKGERGVTG